MQPLLSEKVQLQRTSRSAESSVISSPAAWRLGPRHAPFGLRSCSPSFQPGAQTSGASCLGLLPIPSKATLDEEASQSLIVYVRVADYKLRPQRNPFCRLLSLFRLAAVLNRDCWPAGAGECFGCIDITARGRRPHDEAQKRATGARRCCQISPGVQEAIGANGAVEAQSCKELERIQKFLLTQVLCRYLDEEHSIAVPRQDCACKLPGHSGGARRIFLRRVAQVRQRAVAALANLLSGHGENCRKAHARARASPKVKELLNAQRCPGSLPSEGHPSPHGPAGGT